MTSVLLQLPPTQIKDALQHRTGLGVVIISSVTKQIILSKWQCMDAFRIRLWKLFNLREIMWPENYSNYLQYILHFIIWILFWTTVNYLIFYKRVLTVYYCIFIYSKQCFGDVTNCQCAWWRPGCTGIIIRTSDKRCYLWNAFCICQRRWIFDAHLLF